MGNMLYLPKEINNKRKTTPTIDYELVTILCKIIHTSCVHSNMAVVSAIDSVLLLIHRHYTQFVSKTSVTASILQVNLGTHIPFETRQT